MQEDMKKARTTGLSTEGPNCQTDLCTWVGNNMKHMNNRGNELKNNSY